MIRNADDDRDIIRRFLFLGVNVIFDDFGDFHREPPKFRQNAAAFRVRESQDALFHFIDGGFSPGRFLEDFTKILGEEDGVDEKADVMEQAAKVRLFVVGGAEHLREVLRDQRGAQAVTPKHLLSHAAAQIGKHQWKAAGESQIANAPNAQGEHRFADGRYFATMPEQRRIGHAQTLRGEGFVIRDGLGDAIDVDFAAASAQGFAKGGQDRGHGGQIVHPLHALRQDIVGDLIHSLPQFPETEGARAGSQRAERNLPSRT